MIMCLKFYNTNLIFTNSRDQILRLACLFHSSYLKDNQVNNSLEFLKREDVAPNFVEMMDLRCNQARRSILVQVNSDKKFSQVNEFCSTLGQIKNIYNYVLPVSKLSFSLVEFNNLETLSEINPGYRQPNFKFMHLFSPFFSFHKVSNNLNTVIDGREQVTNSGLLPSELEITSNLMKMESVSDQILKLYELTRLNELGIRLRFLTAYQIELALSGIFPGAECLLFGSSVNGCGRLNSDLDLVLNFNSDLKACQNDHLMYQLKTKFTNDRLKLQKQMEILADIIHNFLPGCCNVIRILQARVPIIKYKQDYTGIDCDLSLTNNNSVIMSKLLYTLSSIDWRVRPLLLTIKHWAEKVNITNPHPGRWISNFSLSLLVIFYLQQIKIIPNIDQIFLIKRLNDKDNEVTGTFLYNVIQTFINKNEQNTSLSDIIYGFFEYYLKFDFVSNGISVNSGKLIIRPKRNVYEAMYIVNPLEQELNVSKNVSVDEIMYFKINLGEAINLLSHQLENGRDDTCDWGLIPLLKNSTLRKKIINMKQSTKVHTKHRLVNISELYSANDS